MSSSQTITQENQQHDTYQARLGAELSRDEIQHYSRHLIIPEVGLQGQRKLKGARVLMVGAGGLGSPVGMYLAAAGVGTIGIVEFDTVEVSNLHRQLLYTVNDAGKSKLECAVNRLSSMNPHINVVAHPERITADNALALIEQYDLVVDGTDNFPTRYLVNDACVLLGKPNVYASIFRFEGLVSLFNHDNGPCYRCLYPSPPPPGFAPSCAEGGVFGVLPGIIGSLQAAEVIKLITGVGDSMSGRLLQFDGTAMKFREFEVSRDPECSLCGEQATQTELIDYVSFCGVVPDAFEATDEGLEPEEIDAMGLKQKIDNNTPFQLLDVRTVNEFEIVNIDGAFLIPLDEIEEHLHTLSRDQEVVCYCKSGKRSLMAAKFLLQKGFRQVSNLTGGIESWIKEVDHEASVY